MSRAVRGEPCCGSTISRAGLDSSVTRRLRRDHEASKHRPASTGAAAAARSSASPMGTPGATHSYLRDREGPAVSCRGASNESEDYGARGCGSRWNALRCRHGYRSHRPGARGDAGAAAADGGGLPRLQTGPSAAGGARRLRDAPRILGHRHRDRLDLRSGQLVPRRARTPLDGVGQTHRRGARRAGEVPGQHRPDRTGRGRRAAPHHAGGRDGVPAPGARPGCRCRC